MKGLSIEEKAKAYEQAIKRANAMIQVAANQEEIYNSVITIFPELKGSTESEDERIRKGLIAIITDFESLSLQKNYSLSREDILAWLEKQGEHANFRNKIQIGDKVTRNEDGVLINLSQLNRVAKKDEKQGEQKVVDLVAILKDYFATTPKEQQDKDWEELKHLNNFGWELIEQKPTWSEEEKKKLDRIYYILGIAADEHAYSNTCRLIGDKEAVELQDFLRSIAKPDQKPAEWSKEDEENFARVDYACIKVYGGDSYSSDWLRKFLGIHKKWKPSDEQMDALNDVISSRDIKYDVLSELWKDLKKLREE